MKMEIWSILGLIWSFLLGQSLWVLTHFLTSEDSIASETLLKLLDFWKLWNLEEAFVGKIAHLYLSYNINAFILF